jgi:hypothetical protein
VAELDPISFVPSDADEAPEISFIPTQTQPVPTHKTATVRAAKADYALGEKSPGYDPLFQQMIEGREYNARQHAAFTEGLQWQAERNQIIEGIAKKQGGAVGKEDLEVLMSMSRLDFQQDPKTIFEKKFAEKYGSDHVASTMAETNNVYSKISGRRLTTIQDSNTRLLWEAQVFNTILEDENDNYKKVGTMSSVGDHLMQLVPFYSWSNVAGETPGAPTSFATLAGKNLREQIQYIRSLPLEEGATLARQVIAEIRSHSPLLAQKFAENLVQYSYSDEMFDNATSVLDLSILPAGTLLKAGVRATKNALGVGKFVPKPNTLVLAPWNEIKQATAPLVPGRTGFVGPTRPTPGVAQAVGEVEDIPNLGLRGGRDQADTAAFGPRVPEGRREATKRMIREDLDNLPPTDEGSGLSQLSGQALPSKDQYLRSWDRFFDAGGETQAARDAALAHRMAVQATAGTTDPGVVLSLAGDAKRASALETITRFQLMDGGSEGVIQIEKEMASYNNPWNWHANGTSMVNRRAIDMMDRMVRRGEELLEALGRSGRVARLPQDLLTIALAETAERLSNTYLKKVNDAFLDMVHIPAQANPANIDVMVMRLGKPGEALPMASRDEAIFHAEDIFGLQKGEYNVFQQGQSFYVGIPAHVRENSEKVLSATYTPARKSGDGWLTAAFGRLGSVDNYLSNEASAARKIAQHGQQNFRREVMRQLEFIQNLPRKQYRELKEMLIANRDGPAQKAHQDRGMWYENVAEWENAFFTKFNKLPTDDQTEAYAIFRQVNDTEWLMANLSIYRDKAIAGVEQLSIRMGAGMEEKFFEGVIRENIPWGNKDDASIGIFHHDSKTWSTDSLKNAETDASSPLTRARVEEYQKQGYRIAQVYDAQAAKLGQGAPDGLNYVLVKELDRKPISWKQLDYNPGGHVVYPYQWYVKQPLLKVGPGGKLYYHGDNSVMNFATEAEAIKYSKRMEEARQLLRAASPNLDAYLAKNLPYTREQFEGLFKNRLDIDQPIRHSQSGHTVYATDGDLARAHPNAVMSVNNSHDLTRHVNRQYTQDRDNILSTVRERNGILQIVPAEQLDPYAALQQGMNARIRSLWMNDYKHMAVKQWIEEFADVLEPSIDQLRSQPYQSLYNPKWKSVGGSELTAKSLAAGASRRAIMNFLGQRTELGEAIISFQNKVVSSIYDVAGQRTSTFVADHILPIINDPAQYARSAAFHLKLGLFNPIQVTLQMQTLAHVTAIAGVRDGTSALAAATWSRMYLHANDDVLAGSFGKLTKSGWSPDELMEAHQAMRSSGWAEIMGETAMRNDHYDQKLFRTSAGWVLDKGAMFFNEAERYVRMTAWFASYKHWKRANGTRPLDDGAISEILNRADLMSANMTRASLAEWQHGILATPLQFATYHLRIAEQLIGNRLTGMEKLRVLTMYSALYGVPTALGAGGIGGAIGGAALGMTQSGPLASVGQGAAGAIGMWPVYDDIRAEALKRNINISDNWLMSAFNSGLLGFSTQLLGREYAVSQRMGPGNNPLVRDALRKDEPLTKVLGGASSSIVGDLLSTTMPFMTALAGLAFGGGDGPELTLSDLNRVMSNISTWGALSKAHGILQYGKHYAKDGKSVADAMPIDAAMTLFGLTPQSTQDIYTRQGGQKDTANAQEPYKKQAIEEFRRSMQYRIQRDHDKADLHHRNALAYMKLGDFNPKQQLEFFREARKSLTDLEDRVPQQALKKSTASQYLNTFKTFHTPEK